MEKQLRQRSSAHSNTHDETDTSTTTQITESLHTTGTINKPNTSLRIHTTTHPTYHRPRGTTPPHTHVLTKTSREVVRSAHPNRPDPTTGRTQHSVGVLAQRHKHSVHRDTHDETAAPCSTLTTDTPYTTHMTHERNVDTYTHTPTHPTYHHSQSTAPPHTHILTKIPRTVRRNADSSRPDSFDVRLESRVRVQQVGLGRTGTAVRSMRGKACPPTMSKTSVGKTPAKPRVDHHHRPIHSANAHKKTHPAFPIHISPPRITRPKSKKGLEIPGANFPT